MNAPVPRPARAVRLGDVVIALFLLGVFVLGYVYAQAWPFRAKLFPEMVSTAGMALAALKLIGFAVQASRGGTAKPRPDVSDQDQTPETPEYVFGTAGRRAWAGALGWVAAFFLSLWLLGVFVTVPLFAISYLRIAGKAGWLGASVYGGVAGGVIWLVFSYVLAVPMPTGIF
ncbi:MAG: tripartite tricarboxylate transporter TctB family protein [Carbonactinosporaceae bacterium]